MLTNDEIYDNIISVIKITFFKGEIIMSTKSEQYTKLQEGIAHNKTLAEIITNEVENHLISSVLEYTENINNGIDSTILKDRIYLLGDILLMSDEAIDSLINEYIIMEETKREE